MSTVTRSMPNDIVGQLLAVQSEDSWDRAVCVSAAKEIERLRELLRTAPCQGHAAAIVFSTPDTPEAQKIQSWMDRRRELIGE